MTTDLQPGPEAASPDDIQERVLKVIATTKRLPRESVSVDSTFEQLGIDSLDRLNILFDLESEFDIQINDEEAKQVENIRQMIAGVRHLVETKGSGPAGMGAGPTGGSAGEAGPASSASEEAPDGKGFSEGLGEGAGAKRNPASSVR